MGIFDNAGEVFPANFFNVQNPTSPWVSIQFRSDASLAIDDINGWEEITMNPSNYFDKLTIEDAGGLQNLSMTLVDKEFTRLETLVIKSIATVNNAISKNSKVSAFKDQALNFKLDKESLINLRIRIGYSEIALTDGSNNFIDATSLSEDSFTSRINSAKTVIRSPWIYFMINNVDFQLTDFGLSVEIKAWSIINVLLDQAKIMKVFAVYKNTPKEFFKWVSRIFEEITGTAGTAKKLKIEYEEPVGPKNESGTTLAEVTIELGTNAVINPRNPSFISIKEVLNIFCSKITPKTFKSSGAELQDTDATTDLGMTSSYSYVYKEGSGTEADVLKFYYPDPTKGRQSKIRNYMWREYGTSIVKSFSVSSNTNFAALNSPIPINNITDGNMNLVKGRTEVIEYLNEKAKTSPEKMPAGYVKDVEVKINSWINIAKKPDDYALVSSSIGRSNDLNIKDAFHPAAAAMVSAINDQVFNGTLTIPGDPFYFFDDNLRPMEYAVRVVLLRPAYIDEKGAYTGVNSSLERSYLSGNYLLKKITHTIDINGFSTNLDIMRSPLE